MAKKTLTKPLEEYIGTNSKDFINVFGQMNKVRARNGNDEILIKRTDKFVDMDIHQIDGGAGNDKITVKTCTDSKIYGGSGNDTIIIEKGFGGNNEIYGESGSDTIKIQGGINDSFGFIKAGKGDDKILISGGKYFNVYGDQGKDQFTVSGGSFHNLYGGIGDDVITVKKGNSMIIDGGSGKDKITVSGGKNHSITSGTGDTIKISGSAKSSNVDVSSKKSNVTISGGSKNTVMISGKSNTFNVSGGSNNTIETSDKNGNNTFNVSGGSYNIINNEYGNNNTINVSGGTKNQITGYLADNLAINVSGRTTTCNVKAWDCSGSITLKSGKTDLYIDGIKFESTLTLNAAKGTVSGNKLNLSGVLSMNYSHSGNTLIMTEEHGFYTLKITDFLNGAFSNGIEFDLGPKLTFEEIKKQAGW